MPLVRAPVADLAEGERALDAASGHYVVRVLRLRAGDAFVAFDPARAVEGDACIVHTSPEVRVRIAALRPARVVAGREVLWIQGLAKGDKCDAVVQDATELGVTRFVAAMTERTIVKLDDARAAQRRARWEKIAREAARQCGRGDAPAIEAPRGWGEALALASGEAARFCLYELATEPLAPHLDEALREGRALAFAVGPEGGITDDEAREAAGAGYLCVSLGPLILRTETVAAAVLGAVRVWSGFVG